MIIPNELILNYALFNFDDLINVICKLISTIENIEYVVRIETKDNIKKYYLVSSLDSIEVANYNISTKEQNEFNKKSYFERLILLLFKNISFNSSYLTFNWLINYGDDFKEMYIIENSSKKLLINESNINEINNSECSFKNYPYVQDFMYCLVNYRIKNQLIEITIDEINLVLDDFIKYLKNNPLMVKVFKNPYKIIKLM